MLREKVEILNILRYSLLQSKGDRLEAGLECSVLEWHIELSPHRPDHGKADISHP